jgi:DNA invertase Pin-like site-specific DNA recombinase
MVTFAYRRVSTDRQAEQGYGLDAQAAALDTWAEAAGLPILETFTDAGVSGACSPLERPAFAALLLRARELGGDSPDSADGRRESACALVNVVLPRLDRLARDLLIQEQALADLWATGATVYDASTGQAIHPDDPDDPTRTLIRQVLGAVAQYDRAAIGARMRAGRAAKRRAGGYADGAPPFGWRAVGGELVEDPSEQATLARMIHLRDSGLSLRVIGDVLAREGHQPRRADRFHPKVLAYILNREQLRKVTT